MHVQGAQPASIRAGLWTRSGCSWAYSQLGTAPHLLIAGIISGCLKSEEASELFSPPTLIKPQLCSGTQPERPGFWDPKPGLSWRWPPLLSSLPPLWNLVQHGGDDRDELGWPQPCTQGRRGSANSWPPGPSWESCWGRPWKTLPPEKPRAGRSGGRHDFS